MLNDAHTATITVSTSIFLNCYFLICIGDVLNIVQESPIGNFLTPVSERFHWDLQVCAVECRSTANIRSHIYDELDFVVGIGVLLVL